MKYKSLLQRTSTNSRGELRSYIKGEFRLNVPESDSFALGYYQKARGNSKIYLVNENDMDTMYSQYAEAQEIPLWCDGRSGELDNSDTEPSSHDHTNFCTKILHRISLLRGVRGDDDN